LAPLRTMRHWLFGDRPPLTEEERRLVLRAMAVIAVPLATITALILLVGGAFAVDGLRQRTTKNKEAIARSVEVAKDAKKLAAELNRERIDRENALAWQVYDECVENENQDATNSALFRQVRDLVKQGPQSPASAALLEGLSEAIDAREPEGEMDCVLPLRPRPEKPPR